MRRRSRLLATLVAGGVVLLITLPGGVEAITIQDVSVVMSRSDFYINGTSATALATVTYGGGNPKNLEDVEFSWWRPDGSLARSATLSVADTANATDSAVLDQVGVWWVNATYVGTAPQQCSPTCYDNASFSVLSQTDAVIVTSITVAMVDDIVEVGNLAEAVVILEFVGNPSLFAPVSVSWYDDNMNLLDSQLLFPDGAGVARSQWFVDQVGLGFLVVSTYGGIDVVTDRTHFDAVPLRVDFWWSGNVTSDTTWDLSGGVLGVCENVTVKAGATLTIRQRSIVRFCKGATLTVEGILRAESHPDGLIVLTTYEAIPQRASPGDWGGVVFSASAIADSALRHVLVEYVTHGITIRGGDPALENVTVRHASQSGILVDATSLTASNLSVSEALIGVEAVDATLTLSGGDYSSNDHGIVLTSSAASLTAVAVAGNRDTGILGTGCGLILGDSSLEGNANQGIRLDGCADIEVSETTISGGTYGFRARDTTNLRVVRSIIMDAQARVFDLTNVSGMTVDNSTLLTTDPAALHFLSLGSTVTTVNSTFSVDRLNLIGSKLHVKNFLHLFVGTSDGEPLGGAAVTITVNGLHYASMTTREDGWIRWILLEDAVYEQSGVTKRENVVTVHLTGYVVDNGERIVDIQASRTEFFTAAVPPGGFLQAPLVGDFWLLLLVVIASAVLLAAVGVRRRQMTTLAESDPVAALVVSAQLVPGKAYVVAGDSADGAYQLLARERERGSTGICITRTFPADLRKSYALKGVAIKWLSRDAKGGGVNPTNLGAIVRDVTKLLDRASDASPVVLLDGLDYLMIQNDFPKVLKLVHTLTDTVSVRGARLLIPFNLEALDPTRRALLTRGATVLEA